MVSIGNALLAGSYVLDQTAVGPSTTVVASTVAAALGSGCIASLGVTNPDTFDFESSGIQQYFATIVFVGGTAAVLIGILFFALAVVE